MAAAVGAALSCWHLRLANKKSSRPQKLCYCYIRCSHDQVTPDSKKNNNNLLLRLNPRWSEIRGATNKIVIRFIVPKPFAFVVWTNRSGNTIYLNLLLKRTSKQCKYFRREVMWQKQEDFVTTRVKQLSTPSSFDISLSVMLNRT